LLALLWPEGTVDDIPVYGLVYQNNNYIALWTWIYCLFVFFAQDFCKVGVFWLLYRFNAFNIKGDRMVDVKKQEKKLAKQKGKQVEEKEVDEIHDTGFDTPLAGTASGNTAPAPTPTHY
jgi:H+-transporting ATPase